MFNVCPRCGMYTVEKQIKPLSRWQALAICPSCGAGQTFSRLPLFIVTGASGTGKTRLCLELAPSDRLCVHLETDILWGQIQADPRDDYRTYREAWLRLAKNISQGGKPVVLYGSATPSQFEVCTERLYFEQIYSLALVCQPEVLTERLRSRPGWRGTSNDDFIRSMIDFNQWLIEHVAGESEMDLLDTSLLSVRESVDRVKDWIRQRWAGESLLS